MFQHEIEAAVRQATEGRWTIEGRSPKSAIGVLTVDASRVVDIQMPYVANLYTEKGVSAEYAALNRLLIARTELNALIERLRVDGYGDKHEH